MRRQEPIASHSARIPERPPARTPSDPRYFDARDLEAELRRSFQICHECRMCVGYCGAFPELFARVDRDVDGGRAVGAERLTAEDVRAVSDQCWQCKLCYIKCPYTADEGSAELLDVPRLLLREKAARAAADGVALVDRVLAEPELIGRLGGGRLAPVTRLITRSRLLRRVREKTLGIAADFPLPVPARQSFRAWLGARTPAARSGEAGDVVLFAGCHNERYTPAVPRAAVLVLEHAGFRVVCPSEEVCCGMPSLDGGDVPRFVEKARRNVAAIEPLLGGGALLAVASATCGYVVRHDWPDYLGDAAARSVGARATDLMELLEALRLQGRLPTEVERGLGRVAYHAACHLRAQKVGLPGARLLARLLPDTEVRVVEACSAVDGTWGMKASCYATGRRYAEKLVLGVREIASDFVVSDCQLSAVRIANECGQAVLHPVQALALAYGLDPDPEPVTRDFT